MIEDKQKLTESFAARYFESSQSLYKATFTNIIHIKKYYTTSSPIDPYYKPISKIQSKINNEK
jgi:hypothetical protein